MATLINRVGQRFGRLTVIERANGPARRVIWRCRCDCGNTSEVVAEKLGRRTNSCGCLSRDLARTRNATHGCTRSNHFLPEYNVWRGIKQRCLNPKNAAFNRYGGRGITMPESWVLSFANFFADMGLRPSDKHTIERIDNDGHYSAENCRWATRTEQNRNKGYTIRFNIAGNTVPLGDLADQLGIKATSVRAAVRTRGEDPYTAAMRLAARRR